MQANTNANLTTIIYTYRYHNNESSNNWLKLKQKCITNQYVLGNVHLLISLSFNQVTDSRIYHTSKSSSDDFIRVKVLMQKWLQA